MNTPLKKIKMIYFNSDKQKFEEALPNMNIKEADLYPRFLINTDKGAVYASVPNVGANEVYVTWLAQFKQVDNV